jgi:hypothetical protein
MSMYTYKNVDKMFNVYNTCTCKSHLQSGEKQIGYGFGIFVISRKFLFFDLS